MPYHVCLDNPQTQYLQILSLNWDTIFANGNVDPSEGYDTLSYLNQAYKKLSDDYEPNIANLSYAFDQAFSGKEITSSEYAGIILCADPEAFDFGEDQDEDDYLDQGGDDGDHPGNGGNATAPPPVPPTSGTWKYVLQLLKWYYDS